MSDLATVYIRVEAASAPPCPHVPLGRGVRFVGTSSGRVVCPVCRADWSDATVAGTTWGDVRNVDGTTVGAFFIHTT